jgi:hypothetical protein
MPGATDGVGAGVLCDGLDSADGVPQLDRGTGLMTGYTIVTDLGDKSPLISAGLALIDMGYRLGVTTGPKGNMPYLPEWQTHPIPASHWEQFVNFPRTTGIGALTAGLAVIDIDGAEGLTNWNTFLDEHDLEPSPFRQQMVSTPGGGYHLYLQDPYQAVSNAGGMLGPINKIDVRGTGGFIAMPPTDRVGTPGYRWIAGPLPIHQLPQAPPWLTGKLRRTSSGEWALSTAVGDWKPELTAWGEEQITTLAMRIADVGSGGRHQALIIGSVAAGHLVAEGKVTVEYAYASLGAGAQAAGMHDEGREAEVKRTILDGFVVALSARLTGLETLIDSLERAR